jgi:hypothetical protein
MRRLAAFAIVTLCLSLTILNFARAADEPGKTFKPDDEGYLRNWLLLEPIKLTEDVSSHTEEQEKPVFDKDFVKKDHAPKDGGKLKANDAEYAWAAKEASDAIVDLTGTFEGKDNQQCVFLGVVYVTAPQEIKDAKLSIGSDDSSLWRLNGQEVVRVYAQRQAEKDTDQSKPITLKKGVNTLQFAVIQGDGPAAAVARFVDKDGKPIKGLTLSLTPGEKK